MKQVAMGAATIILIIAGFATLRSMQDTDVVGATPVGQVLSVSEAAPHVPRGFLSWFFGDSQIDRIAVTTPSGRYLVSGLNSLPVGQDVEVRDTIDKERLLCVTNSTTCGRLWNDATVVPIQNEEGAQFRSMTTIIGIMAGLCVFMMALAIGLRGTFRF